MQPKNTRAVRTAFQTFAAVVAPRLVGVATAAAVAGVIARAMASPAIEALLDRFGLGLVDDKEPTAL